MMLVDRMIRRLMSEKNWQAGEDGADRLRGGSGHGWNRRRSHCRRVNIRRTTKRMTNLRHYRLQLQGGDEIRVDQ